MKYGPQISVVVIILMALSQIFCGPIARCVCGHENLVLLSEWIDGKEKWRLEAHELIYNLAEDTIVMVPLIWMYVCFRMYVKGWVVTGAFLFIILQVVQYINDCTNPYEFDISKLRMIAICSYLVIKWGYREWQEKNKVPKRLFD